LHALTQLVVIDQPTCVPSRKSDAGSGEFGVGGGLTLYVWRKPICTFQPELQVLGAQSISVSLIGPSGAAIGQHNVGQKYAPARGAFQVWHRVAARVALLAQSPARAGLVETDASGTEIPSPVRRGTSTPFTAPMFR
jgi:hypothetical protein